MASSDALLQSWKDESPYAYKGRNRTEMPIRDDLTALVETLYLKQTANQWEDRNWNHREKDSITSKIGLAPVKNRTASAYASALMHFPSRTGRS